jgi:hypothetical protein
MPSVPKKGYATMPERSHIYMLLSGEDAVCKKGEDGRAHFAPGWNDARVARQAIKNLYGHYDEVRASVIKSSAASARLQLVGKLKPSTVENVKNLSTRIVTIESENAKLKVQVDKMDRALAELTEKLGGLSVQTNSS